MSSGSTATDDEQPGGRSTLAHMKARTAIITVLVLLPAILVGIHLMVHPLWPLKERAEELLSAQRAEGHSPDARTFSDEQQRGYALSRARMELTLGVALVSCSCVAVTLGLLNVSHPFLLAIVLATISTGAYIVYDGQGAFVGPIALALPFWFLTEVTKMIRNSIRCKEQP